MQNYGITVGPNIINFLYGGSHKKSSKRRSTQRRSKKRQNKSLRKNSRQKSSRRGNSRKLFGGAKVGSGAYGWVYDYPLGNNKIIKIFYEPLTLAKHANIVRMNQTLLDLDPNREYFNTYDEMKYVTMKDIEKLDVNIASQIGADIVAKDENIPNIFTIQIADKVQRAIPIENWIGDDFRHALVGLFLLHRNNICHGDLHLDNIGFKNSRPIFYDFDLATDGCGSNRKYDDFTRIFEQFIRLAREHQQRIDTQRMQTYIAANSSSSSSSSSSNVAASNAGASFLGSPIRVPILRDAEDVRPNRPNRPISISSSSSVRPNRPTSPISVHSSSSEDRFLQSQGLHRLQGSIITERGLRPLSVKNTGAKPMRNRLSQTRFQQNSNISRNLLSSINEMNRSISRSPGGTKYTINSKGQRIEVEDDD